MMEIYGDHWFQCPHCGEEVIGESIVYPLAGKITYGCPMCGCYLEEEEVERQIGRKYRGVNTMVQVTMTGKEYAELLKAQERLEELLEALRRANIPTIDKDIVTISYHHPEFPDILWPGWLTDKLMEQMVTHLLNLDNDQFKWWVQSGDFYFNPMTRDMTSYERGRHYIYLPDMHPALRQRVKDWREFLAEHSEEENDIVAEEAEEGGEV